MELVCKPLMNGIMAYWSEVENTASYNVTLYINNQAISKKINPRTELYCTFNGLAAIDGSPHYAGGSYDYSGLDYYIKVVAEDRDGNIIEKSEKVKCTVREF